MVASLEWISNYLHILMKLISQVSKKFGTFFQKLLYLEEFRYNQKIIAYFLKSWFGEGVKRVGVYLPFSVPK